MDQNQTQDDLQISKEEIEQLKQNLPKAPYMCSSKVQLVKYQGFWCLESFLPYTLKCQRHFCARDTDLIIASIPKTGTTWLKSLLFSAVNRDQFPLTQSPLHTNNPHELILSLEQNIYTDASEYVRPHQLNELPSPRLFSTHMGYTLLPESVKASKCQILYITRNPLDMFVSQYYFSLQTMEKILGENCQKPSIQDFFEGFIQGKHPRGPFFDHVLGYWRLSLEQPEKVLFLKYEDLKDDPVLQLKRVADFIGKPFSPVEESQGVVEEIVAFCSFNNLKELEGNKTGNINKVIENKIFFRKGDVGDWTNHFTPLMLERMHQLMNEQLEGTGLSFKLYS